MMKNIFAAVLVSISSNLFAAEFTSISLQGRLSSTDTINNVRVFLDAADLGASLTLVPDAKGVFSTKFLVSPPDALSQCSACLISLKKLDGTVLSTSSLRSVPFALTVRGDGPDANLIRASGNIGINTPNPAYKLDVYGDVRSTGSYYGNGTNLTGVLHTETDPLSVKKMGDTMSGTLNMGSQQITGAGSLTMSTGTITGNAFSVGGATLAVVNGRVGIGTASPGANLEVAGNVKIADGTQGLGKVLTSNASGLATWQVPASTFSIGDSYGGGKIFWIDAVGKQVLIAALEDQAAGVMWSNNSNTTGAILDGIYAGKANTVLISTMQGAGSYAARICSDYSVVVNNEYYDDWYLPSKYELSRLFDNRTVVGNFPVTNSLYWSSNEDVMLPSAAWQVAFPSGGLANNFKNTTSSTYVRCVRAGPSTTIGNLPTNAETVTNGAYVTSTQTFTGSNIFKDLAVAAITADSATITGNSGVYGLTVSSNVSLAATLYSSNGDIGIGVSSPAYKLDVDGDVNITGAYKINGIVPPGLGDAILSATQTFTGANTFAQKLTVAGLIESTSGGIKFPDGSVQSAAASSLWGISGNNIYNTNSGKVGIGTNNPSGPLEVDINSYSYVYVWNVLGHDTAYPRCTCDTTAEGGECSVRGFTSIEGAGPKCLDWFRSSGKNYAGLFSRETTSSHTALIVTNTSNIGIGTPNPGQKLTVAGTIESTSGGVKFPDGTVQTTADDQSLAFVAKKKLSGGTVIFDTLSPGRYKVHAQLENWGSLNNFYLRFNNDVGPYTNYKWANYIWSTSGTPGKSTGIATYILLASMPGTLCTVDITMEFSSNGWGHTQVTGTGTIAKKFSDTEKDPLIVGTTITGYYYGSPSSLTLSFGAMGPTGEIALFRYR